MSREKNVEMTTRLFLSLCGGAIATSAHTHTHTGEVDELSLSYSSSSFYTCFFSSSSFSSLCIPRSRPSIQMDRVKVTAIYSSPLRSLSEWAWPSLTFAWRHKILRVEVLEWKWRNHRKKKIQWSSTTPSQTCLSPGR